MANQKEQKVGLFRRLFGMDEPEPANRKSGTVPDQDAAAVKSAVYPDRDSVAPDFGTSLSAGVGGEPDVLLRERKAPDAAARQNREVQPDAGQRKEPTWEELLNKIAPPLTEPVPVGQAGDTDQGILLDSTHSEPEKLPWEIDLEQIQTQQISLTPGGETEGSDASGGPGAVPAGEAQGDDFPRAALQVVDLTLSELRKEAADPGKNADPTPQNLVSPPQEGEIEMGSMRQENTRKEEAPALDSDPVPAWASVVREKTPMQNDNAVWLVQLAGEEQVKGELEKAEKLLETAYILEPHPDVLLARAKVETGLGKLPAAAASVLHSLAEFPDSEEGIELLGMLAEMDAGVDFDRVAALAPGTKLGSVKLARLCLAQDQLAAALDFFGRATRLGLNEDEIQAELGQIYQRMGNSAEAIRHYRLALELKADPDTAASLFDLYLETGSFQEAEEVAASSFKGYSDTRYRQRMARLEFMFGKSLFERDELESALDKFYASMEHGEEDAKDWVIRVLRRLADQSDESKVQEYLETALEVGGFERELAQRLSESYLQTGNDGKARYLLQTLYDADPADTRVTANLAAALQKLGELDQAAELFESLADQGLLERENREQLFNYYRSKGMFEEAKRHLENLYSQESEEFRAGLQSLVWEQIRFRVEQGELDKAWEICRQELGNRPTPDMLGMAMKILSERVDGLIAENQAARALEELEQGRAMGLNVLDLGLKEAALYESVGNDSEALKVYESIARKAPEVWDKVKELYLKAATREYLAGNLAESRKLLEDAHTNMPGNVEIRRALGVLYQETGQYALAAALAQDSMEETEIQVSTDHLNILRPHNYRRVRLG